MADERTEDGFPVFDSIHEVALDTIRRFNDAEEKYPTEDKKLCRLIDDPAKMRASAERHCFNMMRANGQFRPQMVMFSRRYMISMLIDNLPQTQAEQLRFVMPLQLMIATSPIVAYWLAIEARVANSFTDPDVSKLTPSQRSDSSEGLIIVTAGHSTYSCQLHRVDRQPDGMTFKLMPGHHAMGTPILCNLFDGAAKIAAIAQQAHREDGLS
jgi:hypothetical protein